MILLKVKKNFDNILIQVQHQLLFVRWNRWYMRTGSDWYIAKITYNKGEITSVERLHKVRYWLQIKLSDLPI